MNQTNKLLLDMLKLAAGMKVDEDSYQDLWILAVAVQSLGEIEQSSPLLPYKEEDKRRRSYRDVDEPTHLVRMVLKRKQSGLVNEIDIYSTSPATKTTTWKTSTRWSLSTKRSLRYRAINPFLIDLSWPLCTGLVVVRDSQ